MLAVDKGGTLSEGPLLVGEGPVERDDSEDDGVGNNMHESRSGIEPQSAVVEAGMGLRLVP